MMSVLLDLVILAVLGLAVWRGMRRGLVLTICGFLAIFVGFVGASVTVDVLNEPVSRIIQPVIQQGITDTFLQQTGTGIQIQDHPANPLPTFPPPEEEEEEEPEIQVPLEMILDYFEDNRYLRPFAHNVRDALEGGLINLAASALEAVSAYAAVRIARVLIFVVAFIVLMAVWFFFSRALDLAFRLPVLSSLNSWGGGAAGFLKGALLLFVAAWLLRESVIPQQVIDESILLKFFCQNSPLSLLADTLTKSVESSVSKL